MSSAVITRRNDELDEMRDEYDFDYSKAEWGKFAGKVERSKTVVYIEPEVAEIFHDSAAVNAALLSLIEIVKKAGFTNGHSKRRRRSAGKRMEKE